MKLEDMIDAVDLDQYRRLADADEGLASVLATLSTRYAGRFRSPIASIELLQDVIGLDCLNPDQTITVGELYKIIYVLDRGPTALQYILKAQAKLKLVNRLDGIDRERCIDEIAEAEADLLLAATEYYNKHFADADQIMLANELISSINDVYLEFGEIEAKPDTPTNGPTKQKKNDTGKAGASAWPRRWLDYIAPILKLFYGAGRAG